jgi:hypothetical protein
MGLFTDYPYFWGTPAFFGMPLGEVVWAAVVGGSWPAVVAHFLDARLFPGS